jgi:hypothetical protein
VRYKVANGVTQWRPITLTLSTQGTGYEVYSATDLTRVDGNNGAEGQKGATE